MREDISSRRSAAAALASLLRELGLALVAAGAVVLLFAAYELVGTNFAEQSSQARLAKQFGAAVARSASSEPSAGTGPSRAGGRSGAVPVGTSRPLASSGGLAPGARRSARQLSGAGAHSSRVPEVALPLPPPGGALDHIVVPAISLNRYVVQGVAEQDLQMGPGHYPGTPLPGQLGNVGIAGHRTTFGAPFFRLNELRKGDLIYLTDMAGTTWVYSVQRMWVVYPDDVGVLAPTRGAELTLTTCNPRFWATTRLVVRAALAGRLAAGTALSAKALPASLATLASARVRSRRLAAASSRRVAVPELLPAKPVPAQLAAGASGTLRAPNAAGELPAGAAVGEQAAGADNPAVGSASVKPSRSGWPDWAVMVGWGLLAVALWVLTRILAARRHRFAKLGVIVVGALVCLLPLWFAFGAAVDLLPANF